MYNNFENVLICDHPLVKHKITILRDKNTGTNEFPCCWVTKPCGIFR